MLLLTELLPRQFIMTCSIDSNTIITKKKWERNYLVISTSLLCTSGVGHLILMLTMFCFCGWKIKRLETHLYIFLLKQSH